MQAWLAVAGAFCHKKLVHAWEWYCVDAAADDIASPSTAELRKQIWRRYKLETDKPEAEQDLAEIKRLQRHHLLLTEKFYEVRPATAHLPSMPHRLPPTDGAPPPPPPPPHSPLLTSPRPHPLAVLRGQLAVSCQTLRRKPDFSSELDKLLRRCQLGASPHRRVAAGLCRSLPPAAGVRA